MLVELLPPSQLAGARVHAVDVRSQVAEVRGRAGAGVRLADRDRAADGAVRLEGPQHAAVLQAERMDAPRRAADVDDVAGDRWIRRRGVLAVESVRPFQFERRHLRSGESRTALIPIVGGRGAPRAPARVVEANLGRRLASRRRCRRRGVGSRGREIRRDRAPLFGRQRFALHAHHARLERRDDPIHGERGDHVARRYARGAAGFMTLLAVRRIERGA